jgi:SAM-dependent methyltransferase
MEPTAELKERVRTFWDAAACGEVYARGNGEATDLERHAMQRYLLEPYIFDFARFHEGAGRDVLDIGVGMGADHLEWARHRPKRLVGIDLTQRAVNFTRQRLERHGFQPDVRLGDAEHLDFEDGSFDIVYSWGVLHHTPDTPHAIEEVRRVLRPGGVARVMIYHAHSLVGYLLWSRYALAAGRPGRSLAEIYATQLESPGTKAYTLKQAADLFAGFSEVVMKVQLSAGDLLEGEAGQRHRSPLLSAARRMWPRPLIRSLLPRLGLFLMVDARK